MKTKRGASDAWHPADVPATRSLGKLKIAASGCTACPLYKRATQTVFGEGPYRATWVAVGEQPGDQEDHQGRPFVGPAGQLLRRALSDAGIDPNKVYFTNAVKHFKWKGTGKRRLHEKPGSRDIAACRPWLLAELDLIKPRALMLLGATAAQAVLGPAVRVMKERGQIRESPWSKHTLVTVHPSSILRAPDSADRKEAYAQLVADLKVAAQYA